MSIKLLIRLLGVICVFTGMVILVLTYYPVAKTEIVYQKNYQQYSKTVVVPVDSTLGIVIPAIGANAAIVPQIDPFDSTVYQRALTRGVAHAQGTVLPGDQGMSFIFAHSSADLLTATKYNSVFYLLSKLKNGDEITIYRNGDAIPFVVTGQRIVKPGEVSYLSDSSTQPSLTLMTCWPPGTDFRRLLVFAKLDRK